MIFGSGLSATCPSSCGLVGRAKGCVRRPGVALLRPTIAALGDWRPKIRRAGKAAAFTIVARRQWRCTRRNYRSNNGFVRRQDGLRQPACQRRAVETAGAVTIHAFEAIIHIHHANHAITLVRGFGPPSAAHAANQYGQQGEKDDK